MSSRKEIVATLKSSAITSDVAADALVEYIGGQRKKAGQTLFQISWDLIELMQEAPPSLDLAFEVARSLTHLPSHTDLTPPTGLFALSRSSSRAALAAVLSRCPSQISIEHCREILLEYLLNQESKLAASGHPRESGGSSVGSPVTGSGAAKGGKGTMSSAMFEEIASKLKDVENSLSSPDPSVLSLILSLRLSLSYFSTQELNDQLLLLPLQDAELALRMYVKRRLPGDGRWSVCKALEALEGNVCRVRPAIRSVIRTVKAKYLLPEQARYQVPLPAPSKSKCITQIQSMMTSTAALRSPGSPTSVSSPGSHPPPYPTNSPSSASRTLDQPAAAYTLELLSEYITREKRESMRALKWIKSGRVTLGKDLTEIEEKVVYPSTGSGSVAKSRSLKSPTPASEIPHANAALIPVFEALRSVYALPDSPTPPIPRRLEFAPISIIDETEPYYSPTLQSVTSALYCNPRLSTAAAVAILMELVEYERDVRVYAGGGDDGRDSRNSADRLDNEELSWGIAEKVKMGLVLESIQRRFPDGEYAEAFRIVSQSSDCPPNLSRAPSYKTIPDQVPGTTTSNPSYFRGNTSRRGSASVGGLQQFQQESPVGSPLLDSPRLETRPARTPPTTSEILSSEATSSGYLDLHRPSSTHVRTSSLPVPPVQTAYQQVPTPRPTLQLDVNQPSITQNLPNTPPPSAPSIPERTILDPELSLDSLEDDFNDILSGYGDAIQPLSPMSDTPSDLPPSQMLGLRTPPPGSSPTNIPGAAVSPITITPSNQSPTAGKSKSSPGRFFHLRSLTDASRPSLPHKRSGSTSYFSKSNTQSSSAETPPAPLPPPKSDRGAPDVPLSPTKWRKEFMASNMLKPAASSASPPARGQAL